MINVRFTLDGKETLYFGQVCTVPKCGEKVVYVGKEYVVLEVTHSIDIQKVTVDLTECQYGKIVCSNCHHECEFK